MLGSLRQLCMPPESERVTPFKNEFFSSIKNIIARETSYGEPILPVGWKVFNFLKRVSFFLRPFLSIDVSIAAGSIALTLIFLPNSTDKDLDSPET